VDAQTAESLLNFAEEAGPRYRGLDAKAVLEQLESKYGDLQAAMQWFIDEGRTDEALDLRRHWLSSGWGQSGSMKPVVKSGP
jgi:hypothetical protein